MEKESIYSRERKDIDVSVVVVVYNQQHSTSLILRSLLSQTYEGYKEIIFTDDGSNIKVFQQLQPEFEKAQIPVRYIWQQDRGIRPALARNSGIQLSRGKYLLFLDGDMVPALDLVEKHMHNHTQNKVMVAGNRRWRGPIDESLFNSIDGLPVDITIKKLEEDWPLDEASQKRESVERSRRKEWLQSTNPWRACISGNLSVPNNPEVRFDENYVGYGNEDWELSYRLYTHHNYIPIYDDNISAYHLESAISNVFRTGKHGDIVEHMRNILYFFDICPGLDIEEAFFGFPRFELDETTNKWSVIPRSNDISREDIINKVQQVRKWFEENPE